MIDLYLHVCKLFISPNNPRNEQMKCWRFSGIIFIRENLAGYERNHRQLRRQGNHSDDPLLVMMDFR
jgi:hypothetical protein